MARQGLRPGVLVALPRSTDPNLSRAVVLLGRHDERGTFGLVINRPSTVTARELCEAVGATWRGPETEVLWSGGPVSPELGWVVHEPAAEPAGHGTMQLTPTLHLSSTPERLRALAAAPPSRIRVFLGSIDWAPGQLVEAMAPSGVFAEAEPALVFDTPADQIWDRLQVIGTRLHATGLRARLRRMFGRDAAIPRATVRPK